jgi:hypothetical protein
MALYDIQRYLISLIEKHQFNFQICFSKGCQGEIKIFYYLPTFTCKLKISNHSKGALIVRNRLCKLTD